MSRIPDIFKKGRLQVVTPVDDGMVGIGIDIEGQETFRMTIPILDALSIGYLTAIHSEGASDICNLEVSSNSNVSE